MENNTKQTPAFDHAEIPEGWVVRRFEQVCLKLLDGTHFSPKSKEGPFKYVTSKNIRNEGLDLGNLYYISEEEHRAIYKRCPVMYGDILLTKDGASTGACCINTLSEEFSLLSSVAVLNVNTTFTLNEYLLQFIQSPIGQKIIQDAISGQAITRITLEKIKRFKIPLPPLPEQRAIARLLSTWDTAIHTTEQLIAQKELRKKWLMQQLLTGKKRLPAFAGENGVEGEWKEHSFDKLLKVVKRPVNWDDSELYKLVSVRRRSGGIFFREALYGHQIKVKDLRNAEIGDFLFSKMQIVHGASALVTKEFEGAKISGSYIATVAKDPKLLNMEFFDWYSKLPYFYHQALISSYGVHIEKMTFDFDTFLQLEIKLPSLAEQTAIARVLQAADKEINLLKAKAVKLREQKKGLMQVLLTGRKRLKM